MNEKFVELKEDIWSEQEAIDETIQRLLQAKTQYNAL